MVRRKIAHVQSQSYDGAMILSPGAPLPTL
jgi:hypothetical protein